MDFMKRIHSYLDNILDKQKDESPPYSWLRKLHKKHEDRKIGLVERFIRRLYKDQEKLVDMIKTGKIDPDSIRTKKSERLEEVVEKQEIETKSPHTYDEDDFFDDYSKMIGGRLSNQRKYLVKETIKKIPFFSEKDKNNFLVSIEDLGMDEFLKAFTNKVFLILGDGKKEKGRLAVYNKVINNIVTTVSLVKEEEDYYDDVKPHLDVLSNLVYYDMGIFGFDEESKLYTTVLNSYKRYRVSKNPRVLKDLIYKLKEKSEIYDEDDEDIENLYRGYGAEIDTGQETEELKTKLEEINSKLEKVLEKS